MTGTTFTLGLLGGILVGLVLIRHKTDWRQPLWVAAIMLALILLLQLVPSQ